MHKAQIMQDTDAEIVNVASAVVETFTVSSGLSHFTLVNLLSLLLISFSRRVQWRGAA